MHRAIVRRRTWCERCGQPGTDVAHIVSRRYSVTRCMTANAWFLCRPCHIETEPVGPARDELVARTIGHDELARLQVLARGLVHDPTRWWQAEIQRLRGEAAA